jgi:hypothetical protein
VDLCADFTIPFDSASSKAEWLVELIRMFPQPRPIMTTLKILAMIPASPMKGKQAHPASPTASIAVGSNKSPDSSCPAKKAKPMVRNSSFFYFLFLICFSFPVGGDSGEAHTIHRQVWQVHFQQKDSSC